MEKIENINKLINGKELWQYIQNIFNVFDSNLVSHDCRVAYYMYRLAEYQESDELQREVFDAFFQNIKDYKSNISKEDNEQIKLSKNMGELQVYLLTKQFEPAVLPTKDYGQVLYDFEHDQDNTIKQRTYKIHLLDILDQMVQNGNTKAEIVEYLNNHSGKEFNPTDVKDLIVLLGTTPLIECAKNGKYMDIMHAYMTSLSVEEELPNYLEMMTLLLDTYSTNTVYHSHVVAGIAKSLGELMGLNKLQCETLYMAGICHDVGKVLIPSEILTKPGKLTDNEMKIMQRHPIYTKLLISKFFNKDIVNLAYSHHEKLDGSGYPQGLTAKDLPLSQRILCVSDITSALYQKRSYKDAFDSNHVIEILHDMVNKNQIDAQVVKTFEQNKNKILRDSIKGMDQLDKTKTNFLKEYSILEQETHNVELPTK